MDVIEIEKNQPVVDQISEIANQDARKKGKIVQKNYVMNDLGALRKKLKHEGRQKEFILAKEASDGSNAIIHTFPNPDQGSTLFLSWDKVILSEQQNL